MKQLNKAHLVFIIALVIFGITVIILLRPAPEPSKKAAMPRKVATARLSSPKTASREGQVAIASREGKRTAYQPTDLSEPPYLSEQFLPYLETGRNPFISPVKKTQIEAQLELPPPIIKKPSYNLFTPLPDSAYYNSFIYTLLIDSPESRYSIAPLEQSDLPRLDNLPSASGINQLIDITKPQPRPGGIEKKEPPDPFPDIIYFRDGTFVKGKYISEDEDKVFFQNEGERFRRSYDKNKIWEIKIYYTPEEQYTQRAEKIKTGDASAHYKLAQWCVEQDLINQALSELKQAIKIDNTQMDFYLLSADLYRRQMDLENELKLYQTALKSPLVKKEVIYLRLGELYEILNMPVVSGANLNDAVIPDGIPPDGEVPLGAIDAFKSAAQTAPNVFSPWLRLSRAYYQAGDYKQAEENYKKARQISPIDPGVIIMEGLLLFKKGELLKAQETLTKVLDKLTSPDAIAGFGATASQRGETYATLGVISTLLSVHGESVQDESAEGGDYSTASDYFLSAIQANPYQASHWVNLAMLYLLAGDSQITNQLLEEALRRDPTSALPYLAQGYLLWTKVATASREGQDKIDEVMQKFQAADKIEPANTLVLYAQGQIYFTKGEFIQATGIFSTLLKKKPLINDCLYYLGLIAFYQNNFSDAISYFKIYLNKLGEPKVVRLRRTSRAGLVSDYAMLGIAHSGLNQSLPLMVSSKEWDTARSYLDQALKINPQYVPALNGLAYLEYQTKHPDQASTLFKKVLTLFPPEADLPQAWQDDPYASNSLKAIQEAATQVIWSDRFNRPDNTTVGEGWREKEEFGIEIEVNNRELRLSGTQALQDNGVTYIERPVNKHTFVRFEANLRITSKFSSEGDGNRAGVGIYLASREKELGYKQGTVFYGLIPSGTTPPSQQTDYKLVWQSAGSPEAPSAKWAEIPNITLSPDTTIRLSIYQGIAPNKRPELRLYLNDRQVATVSTAEARFLTSAKTCTLGIYGYAPIGTNWELLVKSVKVVEKKQE